MGRLAEKLTDSRSVRKRMHGPDRQTMGSRRISSSRITSARRRQGPSLARIARGSQRNPVGFEDGCALERPTGSVSAVPDLPSPLPTVGRRRHIGKGPSKPCRGPIRSGRNRSEGSLHRRLLQRGQKGGSKVGKTKRGKGTKVMAIADGAGLPIAIWIESASPHEVRLVEETLDRKFIPDDPARLIGDKAYDSDGLDTKLRTERGVVLIAPHRRNRRKDRTQDGRQLRRYRRRWKVERLFAWLHNFRRLVVRYEYHSKNFLGMLQLGCIIILLRHL